MAVAAAAIVSAGSGAAGAASEWTVKTMSSDGHFASVSSDGTDTWAFGDHDGKTFASNRTADGNWHDYSTPDIGSSVQTLVTSKDHAWAVGEASDSGSSTIHWNGTKWSSVSVPISDNISTNDIARIGSQKWAAGTAGTSEQHGYVIQTSGTKWSDAKLPSSMFTNVKGISGTSANDVWVVGSVTDWDSDSTVPVAAHWDGKQWKKTTLPSSKYEVLDVVATKSDDVRVAAYRTENSAGDKTNDLVTLHWNGSKWSKSTPSAGRGVAPKTIDKVGGQTWIVGRTVSNDHAAVVALGSSGAWQRLSGVPQNTGSDVTALSGGRPVLVGSTPAVDETAPHPTAAIRGS